MYEMDQDAFDDLVGSYLGAADRTEDPEKRREFMATAREMRTQRKLGQPLAKKQETIEASESEVWLAEWGLISKALLDEENGNPELGKHLTELQKLIAPIFENRKKDDDARFLYRKLADGGVDAKLKHVLRI